MKSVLVFIFALSAVAYAYPRPGDKEETEDEKDDYLPKRNGDVDLFYVPLQRSFPRRTPFQFTLTDDLVPPPFHQDPFFRSPSNPWASPAEEDPQMNNLMRELQQMLNDMRRQVTELLHKNRPQFPEIEVDDSVGTRVGGTDDAPKNKTTSTTKVIDGHVVTVNETTFSSGDDNMGAVFRIKVVEVHPSETPETKETESEKEPEKPVEPEIAEHEPTTSRSELDDNHEETNEIPNAKVQYEMNPELDPSLNEIEDFSVDEFSPHKENFHDLSEDTKVNDYLADQSQHQQLIMMDPDSEFIQTEFRSVYPQRNERLERFRYL